MELLDFSKVLAVMSRNSLYTGNLSPFLLGVILDILKIKTLVLGAFISVSCSSEPPEAPNSGSQAPSAAPNCNTQAAYVPPVPNTPQVPAANSGVAPQGAAPAATQDNGTGIPQAQTFLQGVAGTPAQGGQTGFQQAPVQAAPVAAAPNYNPTANCQASTWTPTPTQGTGDVTGNTALDNTNTGSTEPKSALLGANVGLQDTKNNVDGCIKGDGFFDRQLYAGLAEAQKSAAAGCLLGVTVWKESLCDLDAIKAHYQKIEPDLNLDNITVPADHLVDQCVVCEVGATDRQCLVTAEDTTGPAFKTLLIHFAGKDGSANAPATLLPIPKA